MMVHNKISRQCNFLFFLLFPLKDSIEKGRGRLQIHVPGIGNYIFELSLNNTNMIKHLIFKF